MRSLISLSMIIMTDMTDMIDMIGKTDMEREEKEVEDIRITELKMKMRENISNIIKTINIQKINKNEDKSQKIKDQTKIRLLQVRKISLD